jgi:inner membrane protein
MDSVTQAVFGAGIQGALLGRYQGLRKALLAGAVLGTLPDLDVLIDYGDPISGMINHRGFSHSIFVLTVAAGALTAAMRRWSPSPHYGALRLFITLWLVLITHPLLDALTAYGTQLYWPFKPIPTSWASLFIIDPVFTVPLLLAVLAGLVAGFGPRTHTLLKGALAWCVVYIGLSLGAKSIVENRVQQQLAAAGIQTQAIFSTPGPMNILLWRVVVKTSDDRYVEAVNSLLDTQPAEYVVRPLNSHLANVAPMPELQGLRWFSGDWLRYDVINGQLVVSDLRMGLGTGYYSFRFLVAQQTGPGASWQAIVPEYWPTSRGTSELGRVLERIWKQDPALPLETWDLRMNEPAARAPGRFF